MSEAKIVISAVDRASSTFKSIKDGLSGIGTQASAVGVALSGIGFTGALGGLVALVRRTTDSIDAMNDLSDATGASIENISALEDVARRAGASFDTVSGALIKFNSTLKDAGPGSEAERAFAALGLRVQELKDQDPADALLATAKALSGFADDSNKARLTQELFGKSLREVAPFLKDLADNGKLVATTTAQQAQEAEKFNREIAAMIKNFDDLVRYLSGDLVIGFNNAAKALREGGLLEGMRVLLTGDDQYKNDKRLVELTEEQMRLEKSLARMESQRGSRPANEAVIERQREALARVNAELKTTLAYRKVLQEFGSGQPDPKRPSANLPPPPAKNGSVRDAADANAQSLAVYVNGLQASIDKTNELSEVERARQFLASLGRTGEIEQVRTLLLGLAEQVDAEKESTQVLKDKRAAAAAAGDALTRSNEEYQALIKSLLDATPTAKLEAQRKAMQALAEEFQAGRISAHQFNEAATEYLNLDPAKDPALDNLKEITAAIENMGNRAADVFTEMAMTGKVSFKGMADSIIADILRIQIRQNITQPLTQAVQGIDFKGMFGFASGGVMTGDGPLPLRKYASGGIANSPQLAMFGEGSMPEAYVPLPDGRRIPVAMQGPASAPVVNLSYTFNGPADATQVLTAAQLGAAMAESKIRDSMQRGRM